MSRAAAARETDNKDGRQNTFDDRAEPRLHHSPPINPPSLRNRADAGGQKGQGCLTTLTPAGTAQSWRGNLWITTAPWLESPVGRSPRRTTGIGWTELLAYNAHVARESIDSSGGCPACPEEPFLSTWRAQIRGRYSVQQEE